MGIAIKVQYLTKTYKLYKQHIDRLKETLHPLKKSYHKEFHALDNIGFEVKKGEVVGIIGRNGSGKSTLLKILTGVLTPTEGSVHTKGKIAAILELGAGFNSELTGMENIYLNTSINGLNKKETDRVIDGIVEFSELGDFVYQPVKTYSSGMKSKLAFGVSISLDPDILIIDEALSVGDAAFQRKSFAKIENFKEQGKTIFFVSHSASQVVELCDRAIWLHKGKLVLDGNSKIVTALYQKFGLGDNLDFKKIENEYIEKLKLLEKGIKPLEKNMMSGAFFNKNLQSLSMIEYENRGAHIHNIKVCNSLGSEVNVLVKNEEYFYCYDVTFSTDLSEVKVGMLIKGKSGLPIGGKTISLIKNKKLLSDIKKGDTYSIKWRFKNILNSGTYFFNCGVNTLKNGEHVILHRVLDAYMIEVIKEKDDTANNIIDFGLDLSIVAKEGS